MVPYADLTTESASDVAYAHIRDLILSGDIRPNHRLVEEEIAAQVGVSRTPVREALLRLRQEGLVVQRKGWIVRDHDASEVLEFLEARAALEGETARLAATRILPDTLAELASLLTEMEANPSSRKEINTLNSRFHAIITEAGGNSLLTSFTRSTNINYWNFSTPIIFTEADDAMVNQEHRELYDALERRDGETAARIARGHVQRTAAILARSLGLEKRL